MKYIKRFLDILNEGAYIDPNNIDQAILNYTNSKPGNPVYNDEVLVTAIEKKGYASNVFFPKYYALAPFSWDRDNTKVIDHPGRFKYTMDLLKSGKIVGPNGENAKDAVKNFIGSVISSPNMPKPAKYKYVVSLGSTQGLVKIMSDSVAEITGATQIDLPKINYKNILDSIDIDRFKKEVERTKDESKKEFIDRIKGEIIQELNIFDNDPIILKKIKKTKYETVDDLMADLMGLDSKAALKWSTEIGKYIVRTSGVGSGGGSRKVKKDKYATDLSDFIDAIKDCATSKNKMLIIDDNINSGIDANSVFDAINEVVKKMIGEEAIDSPIKVNRKYVKPEIKGEPPTYIDEYKLNFIFLLLYDMNAPSSKKGDFEIGFRYFLKDQGTDKYFTKLDTSKEVIKDFEKFIKQKPSNRNISIFQELRFSYKPHFKSTSPNKNSPELVVTIDEDGKVVGFMYDNLQYIDHAYSMGWVGDDSKSQISSKYDVRLWNFNIYASKGTKIMNSDGSFTQIFKDWLTRLNNKDIDLFMNGTAITPNSKNWWDSPKAMEDYIEKEKDIKFDSKKKETVDPPKKIDIPPGKTRAVTMTRLNPSTGQTDKEVVWMSDSEFEEYLYNLRNKNKK